MLVKSRSSIVHGHNEARRILGLPPADWTAQLSPLIRSLFRNGRFHSASHTAATLSCRFVLELISLSETRGTESGVPLVNEARFARKLLRNLGLQNFKLEAVNAPLGTDEVVLNRASGFRFFEPAIPWPTQLKQGLKEYCGLSASDQTIVSKAIIRGDLAVVFRGLLLALWREVLSQGQRDRLSQATPAGKPASMNGEDYFVHFFWAEYLMTDPQPLPGHFGAHQQVDSYRREVVSVRTELAQVLEAFDDEQR